MDNDAFKQLVRSKVKSTKDIAREAVEEAFHARTKKRKRKGRRDDDELSSSDSDSDGGRRNNKHAKQQKDDDNNHRQFLKPTAVKKKEGDSQQQKYRDRAKERREGKNEDYKDSENLLQTVAQGEEGEMSLDQAEISKYLGGDEAHTHLVKGLDVALARSARGQKDTQQEQQQQQQQGAVNHDKEDLFQDLKPFESLDQAWNFIHQEMNDESNSNTRTKSALGRSILQYLGHRQKRDETKIMSVSAPGSSIQRTQLTFSIDWHPQNLALSWEIPLETSHAASAAHHTALPKVSKISSDLIQTMQRLQNKKNQTKIIGGQLNSKSTHGNGSENDNGPTEQISDDSDDDIFRP